MTGEAIAKLPAVVVGTGFGCRTIVPALRAAGFDVAGLVGADAERTRQRAEATAVRESFTDLERAITATRAKLVVVATPPHTHAPLSMIALARGCHVLCEKPFAKDAREARAMLAAAERAGVVHMVGHEFRWQPERAIVARAVADGLIGTPKFAALVNFMPLVASPEARMPHWWFDPNSGGGWLGAHGAHIVDQVRVSLGEFASVSASLPMVSAHEGAEDSYLVRFKLRNGGDGMLQQTAGAWGPFVGMERIAGTQGTVWTEGGAVKIADRSGTRELPTPADLVLPPPPAGADLRAALGLGAYTRLCEALRARIEGTGAASAVPAPTFADGVACMEVLDSIRASAAGGGAVVTVPG
jgi:predicted dehydrogenase